MIQKVAMWLCDKDGYEDVHEMLYEGSPAEPWGERWQVYEDDAKEFIQAMARDFSLTR